jgi:hypothetical protein
MLKNYVMLTLLLLLAWTGISQARRLDPPGTVYINGLPCPTACRAYMAWSRRLASSLHPSTWRASYAARHASGVARTVIPLPPIRTAELPPAGSAAAGSEAAPAPVTASPSTDGAATVSHSTTIQEQVAAAAALAERVTTAAAAPRPPQDANNTETSVLAESVHPADAEQPASLPAINTDDLVALVMTQPEIKSVADLSGRDVAIGEQQSASSEAIRTAIAASGAAEVQLSAGHAKAIDRLMSGEVPAAVLTLVSTEAAEWFPEIAGFRIYRVSLSPR